ncbi:unnamed protein product [Timema podura]|uniref:Uncharacterized protein n=1 Tax=Timema podura TaxID=61482 RepID=A0ABN7P3Y5_TIMPD|nr:unnamed protein product [Timema podura]
MFIKLHGPYVSEWNPEPSVKTWLRKHHTAEDTRIQQVKPSLKDEEKIIRPPSSTQNTTNVKKPASNACKQEYPKHPASGCHDYGIVVPKHVGKN